MIRRSILVLLIGLVLTGGEADAARVTSPQFAVDPPDDGASQVQRRPEIAGTATVQKVERVPSGNPLWSIPLRLLTATAARPLFTPGRRPPPPVVVNVNRATAPVMAQPPKPAEPEKPPLSLIGTVAGAAEGIGVFLDTSAKSILRLRAGEDHKGWILRSVQPRQVVLENGRQTIMLALPAPQMNATEPTGRPGVAGQRSPFPPGAPSPPTAGSVPAAMPAERLPRPAPAFQVPIATSGAPPNPFEQAWKQQIRGQVPRTVPVLPTR
jgi:hypothetical protein